MSMKYVTHNDEEINVSMTSLQGELEASYQDLVKAFGLPNQGDGYKTDAEWWLRFDDGAVATIYNWKNGKNYLGPDGLDVEDIDGWHVGCRSRDIVSRVKSALDVALHGKTEAV